MTTDKFQNIKLVRLLSGEEVLAGVTTNDDGSFTLNSPAIVIIQRPPPGAQEQRMQIGLIGWLPYTTADTTGVTVPANSILFQVDPEEGLKASYKEKFSAKGLIVPQRTPLGSGIITPTAFIPKG